MFGVPGLPQDNYNHTIWPRRYSKIKWHSCRKFPLWGARLSCRLRPGRTTTILSACMCVCCRVRWLLASAPSHQLATGLYGVVWAGLSDLMCAFACLRVDIFACIVLTSPRKSVNVRVLYRRHPSNLCTEHARAKNLKASQMASLSTPPGARTSTQDYLWSH